MRSFLIRSLLTCAALAAAPLPASALLMVTYDFDSTNATLAITSPVAVSIPPQGVLSGSIQITFSNDGLGNIIDGPATLDLFQIDADPFSFGALGANLAGDAHADLTDPPIAGTLTGSSNGSGGQLSFGTATGNFHGYGTGTCTLNASICGFIGFPLGVPTTFDGSKDLPMPTLTLGSIHGNLIGLTFGAIIANLTFDAPETSRQLVPEPAAPLLLTVVLGALALVRKRGSAGA
jgi:hypothetical protein